MPEPAKKPDEPVDLEEHVREDGAADEVAQREVERLDIEEAHERSSATARLVYKAVFEEGELELSRTNSGLAWSGVAAGLSMGFSLVAEGLLRSRLPDVPWRPLVTKLGYSVGFVFVVLGRQQLFTENTLTAVLPLLKKWNVPTLLNVLRLWGIVLVTNLLAAAVFAFVVVHSNVFEADAKSAFLAIAQEAINHTFMAALLKGIFAGWLIAFMVWLQPAAEGARLWVIILVTYLVGLGQLTHIIAGSVEAIYAVAAGKATWLQYGWDYMLPTLIGNIIGGTSLVAALNHAQVSTSKT